MLDPAGLGVDLFVLPLVEADYPSRMIEDHAASTGGALIDSSYIFCHFHLFCVGKLYLIQGLSAGFSFLDDETSRGDHPYNHYISDDGLFLMRSGSVYDPLRGNSLSLVLHNRKVTMTKTKNVFIQRPSHFLVIPISVLTEIESLLEATI